jgi:hypothetical protein
MSQQKWTKNQTWQNSGKQDKVKGYRLKGIEFDPHLALKTGAQFKQIQISPFEIIKIC